MSSNHWPRSQTMHPSAPTTVIGLDLDAQIEQIEQRLIARETWLRSTAEALAQRAQSAVTPRPWVLPVVGSVVVLWLGWRLWHRRDRCPQRQVSVEISENGAGRQDDMFADLPWGGLAGAFQPSCCRGGCEHGSIDRATTVAAPQPLKFGLGGGEGPG